MPMVTWTRRSRKCRFHRTRHCNDRRLPIVPWPDSGRDDSPGRSRYIQFGPDPAGPARESADRLSHPPKTDCPTRRNLTAISPGLSVLRHIFAMNAKGGSSPLTIFILPRFRNLLLSCHWSGGSLRFCGTAKRGLMDLRRVDRRSVACAGPAVPASVGGGQPPCCGL